MTRSERLAKIQSKIILKPWIEYAAEMLKKYGLDTKKKRD